MLEVLLLLVVVLLLLLLLLLVADVALLPSKHRRWASVGWMLCRVAVADLVATTDATVVADAVFAFLTASVVLLLLPLLLLFLLLLLLLLLHYCCCCCTAAAAAVAAAVVAVVVVPASTVALLMLLLLLSIMSSIYIWKWLDCRDSSCRRCRHIPLGRLIHINTHTTHTWMSFKYNTYSTHTIYPKVHIFKFQSIFSVHPQWFWMQ